MRYICLFIGVALVLCGLPLRADTMVINFESLNSGDSVTTQFSGLAFSGATVLTAGISLDEFEFPPNSGSNVVFDDGGPLSISFQTPMLTFGGFFTYAAPLTLSAFDASNNLVASATSAFSSNLGLSGEAGSQPNEFLQVSGTGIASISITGDPGGGSFVLDDATFTTAAASVPEPSPAPLLLLAALIVLTARWKCCS